MRHVPIPINPRINLPQLRAELARRQIPVRQFAEASKIAYVSMNGILNERLRPGQLARIKIAAAALELDLQGVVSDAEDSEPAPAGTGTLILISH